jgi:hypothetical protein
MTASFLVLRGSQMQCGSCGSGNHGHFIAEMGIRSPGLEDIDKLTAWVFPRLNVCLDCGSVEFVVSKEEVLELRRLAKRDTAKSTITDERNL